jgi:hypothetical protein
MNPQPLDSLHLKMDPGQRIAHHIRRLGRTSELLSAPCGVTIGAQLIAPLSLTALSLFP